MAQGEGWVIVSGAGGALGTALADHYGIGGRKVLAIDREFARASTAASSVTQRKVDILADDALGQCLAEAISEGDRIDLLINTVGQIWNEPVLTLQGGRFKVHGHDSWRTVIDSNLTAAFTMAAHVAARMARRGGGAIVNFSSIAACGNPGQAAYSAAKAGIEGLTRSMASELGPVGVRVNAVALGFIDVGSTRGALSDKQLDTYAGRTPLGRLGRIEDVIDAVEFLYRNAFVNGEVVKVDGGLRL
jgi:3-oxoacyl-[acyl-carrier protein] reductase